MDFKPHIINGKKIDKITGLFTLDVVFNHYKDYVIQNESY